jgi:hypothetical protein
MPKEVPAFVPAFWLPYFMVADVDASADTAKSLGAKLQVPPLDIPGTGRFASVCDPQGAMFSIYKPKT